eukprot:GHVU01124495.1.p1 GENE.GHVU01124495.1~~GHVU01124495.1.p1  ORF type:complete len:848 (+),score=206.93 GHVU01124495.1:62-2605(+)
MMKKDSSMVGWKVVTRSGLEEDVDTAQIENRLKELGKDLPMVDLPEIIQKVIEGLHDKVNTVELDLLAAQTCAYKGLEHSQYSELAAKIEVSNLHKNAAGKFSEVLKRLYLYKDKQGNDASLIGKTTYDFAMRNAAKLDSAIDAKRDFTYDYFAFKTLERSYLLRTHDTVVETPQYMLMRVAVGIHGPLDPANTSNEENDKLVERVICTYNDMSLKYYTHATPTLFNAGTPKPQMSSCFLLDMDGDSIEGIFTTLKECAMISKTAGGIGVAVSRIRATDSYIRGTNGKSNGIIPMLKVFNHTARYVDQGGGKRKGSFAIYLEPWHADIFEFLDLKKNHGAEELRARDLFYALWVPDLFMQRVEANSSWTLMCPNECPGLVDSWGKEFEELYLKYENETPSRGRRTVLARDLWYKILDSQIETGTPFMVYKDACNRKSNQQNLGTIKSSNLCTEIVQYTDKEETAVCNLASIALPKFVGKSETDGKNFFNFEQLAEMCRHVTINLNHVIDRNFYPSPKAERSNKRHRPVGLGVQGLADTLILLRYPYESAEARDLNRNIFETMYFACLEQSMLLAKQDGPYETFPGSPMSKGILQYHMWENEAPRFALWKDKWAPLIEDVKKYGARNSLLLAPMPTASTSQILGNAESVEPYTQNLYARRTLCGEFYVVNPHLVKDLLEMNCWNSDIKTQLIVDNGSVQNLPIPAEMKELYKTVWEIKQRTIIDLAADRAPFIDQSQSLNIHMASPSDDKLSSMHFYGWKKGLKTGVYYLRTKAAADPIKFTVKKNHSKTDLDSLANGDSPMEKKESGKTSGVKRPAREMSMATPSENNNPQLACKLRDGPNCDMCSG